MFFVFFSLPPFLAVDDICFASISCMRLSRWFSSGSPATTVCRAFLSSLRGSGASAQQSLKSYMNVHWPPAPLPTWWSDRDFPNPQFAESFSNNKIANWGLVLGPFGLYLVVWQRFSQPPICGKFSNNKIANWGWVLGLFWPVYGGLTELFSTFNVLIHLLVMISQRGGSARFLSESRPNSNDSSSSA